MKKLISVCLALALLAMVILPGAVRTEAAGADLLETIRERGKIIIGLEGDWAPWSYVDDTDSLAGYDVEVAQAVAAKLGVEAEIICGEWDGLLAGVDSGRYDIVVNGVDVTEDRSAKYDFSDAYAYIRTVLIVRADNDSITCFEDLKGKKTANSIGSTYMILAEDYGATALGVDTLDETITMVLQGRVDATLNAIVSYTDYMAQHPDAGLKIAALTEEANEIAIPMRKGDETAALREAVNQALAELREEGVLTELSLKYFGEDLSQ